MGIPSEVLVNRMYEKAGRREARKIVDEGLQDSDQEERTPGTAATGKSPSPHKTP